MSLTRKAKGPSKYSIRELVEKHGLAYVLRKACNFYCGPHTNVSERLHTLLEEGKLDGVLLELLRRRLGHPAYPLPVFLKVWEEYMRDVKSPREDRWGDRRFARYGGYDPAMFLDEMWLDLSDDEMEELERKGYVDASPCVV